MPINSQAQKIIQEHIAKINSLISNVRVRESFSRAYHRIYANKIDKDGRNGSVVVEITKRCNKRCWHCYAVAGHNQAMSTGNLNKIIKLVRKSYRHIFITGGEPSLDKRVFTIAIKNPDIIFFMFTNASLIDVKYAKKLTKIGNLLPILSIDGSKAVIHESLKGKGSFKDVNRAIAALNKAGMPWGYLSIVTNMNAYDVLSQKFVNLMRKKGAFLARYLEFIPVGPNPEVRLVPSGKVYYFMEKRKREIINRGQIYLQDTYQRKCQGLLFFDVDGHIKNCPFFHYAKHNMNESDNLDHLIKSTQHDWWGAKYSGECPIYSSPISFKKYLEKLNWKRMVQFQDKYLLDEKVAKIISANYKQYLKIKKERKL
jgi:MoaA/NifB/PqqE/SkfB family radical SAM enzyme